MGGRAARCHHAVERGTVVHGQPTGPIVAALIDAIVNHRKVRLVYRRAKDGVTSIHEVAPVDIRGGDRSTTKDRLYLWAWCFAQRDLEMHVLDRIVNVVPGADSFDPRWLLASWPESRWPKPARWNIPRDWD